MKIRNISGSDLVVPSLGWRMVPAGAVVDVEEDVAAGLLVCDQMWSQVKVEAKAASPDKSAERG